MSIKRKSIEEIQDTMLQNMAEGFQPALSVVFIPVKQNRDAVCEILSKEHIGINSDEMISGNIGSAALRRLDYTVISGTLNTAQRLQGAAGSSQIVITEEAYEKVKQSFNCQRIGSATLKNKEARVTLYEVLN